VAQATVGSKPTVGLWSLAGIISINADQAGFLKEKQRIHKIKRIEKQ